MNAYTQAISDAMLDYWNAAQAWADFFCGKGW